MNISSISNNALSSVAPRTASEEAPGAMVHAALAAKSSSAIAPQTAQAVTPTQQTELSREQLEDAVKTANDFVNPINNSILFALDEDTGITIVKVVDAATKEVIRQIPSEEMLSITKAIDKVKGLLVQQKA